MARARGFTIIEAIITIVVLSIAAPPMLLALREAERQRTAPVQADRGRWLAAERLEEIVADRHASTRGWAYVVNANYSPEDPVQGFPGFSRQVSIQETGASLSGIGTGYKLVRVSVSWRDAGGTKTLEVGTVLTEYSP